MKPTEMTCAIPASPAVEVIEFLELNWRTIVVVGPFARKDMRRFAIDQSTRNRDTCPRLRQSEVPRLARPWPSLPRRRVVVPIIGPKRLKQLEYSHSGGPLPVRP